jgi:glutathione-regulated potassium-efflux system ancillary protein KefC
VELLKTALVLLAAMCVAIPLFKRFKLGAILGYLVAGVLIGPHAFGLIHEGEELLHFSELGVVFFLFLVGLELEPRRLWELRKSVFGLGTAQMVASATIVAGVLLAVGFGVSAAVVAGIGLALSSTAIALQLLTERGVAHAPAGRAGFAILLFQDIAVIPVLAIIPLMATGAVDAASAGAAADAAAHGAAAHAAAPMTLADTAIGIAKALGMIAVVVVGGRFITRPIFRAIAVSRAHEVSVAVALLIVVGAGALMTLVGLSMGMGAFLAGVLLADSEYRHELEANVEPFKGLLLGLFFMAIGMTAQIGLFVERPLVIAGGVIGLVLAKVAVLYVLGRVAGWEGKGRAYTALAMSQGGEFAFVLFAESSKAGVMSQDLASTLVIIVSASMATTPIIMLVADRIMKALEARAPKREFDKLEDEEHPVIIAGFGRYGQIVARLVSAAGMKFTALEVSPEQVDFVRRWGNKVFYGDASRLDLLKAAKAEDAQAFVLCIDDMEASVRTAAVVKKNFPSLPIYARARNRAHVYALMDLGITVLNRETFFSAARMGEEVLIGVGWEREDAQELVSTSCAPTKTCCDASTPCITTRNSSCKRPRMRAPNCRRSSSKTPPVAPSASSRASTRTTSTKSPSTCTTPCSAATTRHETRCGRRAVSSFDVNVGRALAARSQREATLHAKNGGQAPDPHS